MILTLFLPIVLIFISQSSELEAVPSTKGVLSVPREMDTTTPEKNVESGNSATTQSEENSQSATTIIQEGGNEVNINIENSQSGNASEFDISALTYPGSSVSESTQDKLIIESSDNPSQVTDWYQNRIQELEMNTTSFVRTNSNGVVLNKLAAGGSLGNVTVEITSQPGSNSTHIVVTSP